VIKLPKGSSDAPSLRQPPTVSDTTAAAFLRSTIVQMMALEYSGARLTKYLTIYHTIIVSLS